MQEDLEALKATISSTPHTLHPPPYTPHPTPYTLHPSPYTLHPTPHTLHPTPSTLNSDAGGLRGAEGDNPPDWRDPGVDAQHGGALHGRRRAIPDAQDVRVTLGGAVASLSLSVHVGVNDPPLCISLPLTNFSLAAPLCLPLSTPLSHTLTPSLARQETTRELAEKLRPEWHNLMTEAKEVIFFFFIALEPRVE